MAWSIFTTKEYPPQLAAEFEDAIASGPAHVEKTLTKTSPFAFLALVLGSGLALAVQHNHLEKELYVLAGLLVGLGGAMAIAPLLNADSMLHNIVSDMQQMPIAMGRLAGVQFFSWFALFSMWIYTTSAVTQVHFGATDTTGVAFNSGANWVGVLFAAYNGFAAFAATIIPTMQRRLGSCKTHLINLWLGGAALLSFSIIKDPDWLMLPMVGIGFAWASILSIPYALLANHVPAHKMGTYMGIFNFFIVIPQLVAASLLGVMLKWFFHGQPIFALVIGGVSFIIAGLLALLVPENRDV
jgi:maltose/moltooligosaccharide transporter